MLALMPILTYLGIFLVLANIRPVDSLRRASLRAAVICGSYMILSTELLSLLRFVTPLGLSLVWAIAALAAWGWLGRQVRRGQSIRYPRGSLPKGWWDRALLLSVGIILIITGLLAWLVPPQTWDSLNYHLSRVAHWAQDRAVRHFATGIEVQNSMPPGAEIAVLNFYILIGGDRLANFVEWFAMLGSLVGVSLVAKQLGAGTVGQLIAVVFTATLPMGIVQASSTMTDYVVAFWMICLASETLKLAKDGLTPFSFIVLSLAAGLALVTKPTSAAYLLPFAVLVAVIYLRRISFSRNFLYGLTGITIVLTLNGGHFARNYSTYGHPIGPPNRLEEHAIKTFKPSILLSNLLRNASLHAGSPWPEINEWVYVSVVKVHIKMGIHINDPDTTVTGSYGVNKPTTQEDLVGNPLHALIISIVMVVILIARRVRRSIAFVYALTVASTFLLFSLLFKWQIFGSRYHLPFFVLFAPAVGYILCKVLSPNFARLIAVIITVTAWPWLMNINSRPIIPNENSSVESVFKESRQSLLYANDRRMLTPHTTMVEMIQGRDCKAVGLMLAGGGAEYPFWELLGAPDDELYIEWIVSGTPSERYRSPNFQPCAVICESCPNEWKQTQGLPLEYRKAGYRLFIGQGS
jgi:hypothetical protein